MHHRVDLWELPCIGETKREGAACLALNPIIVMGGIGDDLRIPGTLHCSKGEQKCCRLQAANIHQVTSELVIRDMPKRQAAQRSLLRFLRILKKKVPGAPESGRNKDKMSNYSFHELNPTLIYCSVS